MYNVFQKNVNLIFPVYLFFNNSVKNRPIFINNTNAQKRTHDVEDDEPLEGGRPRASLLLAHEVVAAGTADVGRREYQQEQKDAERRAVVHELHERRADEPAGPTARDQQVEGGHDRQQADERDDDDHLGDEVVATPAGDAGVPDGRQQLLTVRMCDELCGHTRARVRCHVH